MYAEPKFISPSIETPEKNITDKTIEKEDPKEIIKTLSTLQSEAEGNFETVLDEINSSLGLNLEPREGTYHITFITPPESGKLKTLSDEDLEELKRIDSLLESGEGINITGIGIIDGAERNDLREKDKENKVCFATVEVPEMQAFRRKIGLPEKDFHITLGFENNDIHMKINGVKENGEPKLEPIEKKPSIELDIFSKNLGPIKVSGLSGKRQ